MKETLKLLRDKLRPIYGNRETEAIIRLIFHYLKGWDMVGILIHEQDRLSPFVKGEVEDILKRLLNHEPIQYITGEAYFHGMDMKVNKNVLIPRPETSELVDIIVDDASNRSDLSVLDVGTGSGCIAIALARTLPFSRVTAIDISSQAIDLAKVNAKDLKVTVNFINDDIFRWKPLEESFDIIVSNPPYIDESEKADMDDNVLGYEPYSALFVPDSDPLVFYRRISEIATHSLVEGGKLYFEINPRHAKELVSMMNTFHFDDVQILKDFYGKDRFLKCVRESK